jgi:uncharacterized protein (TIGR02246 family)
MDAEADRRAISKATAELLEAVNASDVSRMLSVWTEDGVLMPPNHESVHGRAAMETYFRQLFSRSKFRFRFTSSEIQIANDIAFERVTYIAEAWLSGSSRPVEDRGKGLHVYRRQTDRSWKLAQDIWNSDHPAVLAMDLER